MVRRRVLAREGIRRGGRACPSWSGAGRYGASGVVLGRARILTWHPATLRFAPSLRPSQPPRLAPFPRVAPRQGPAPFRISRAWPCDLAPACGAARALPPAVFSRRDRGTLTLSEQTSPFGGPSAMFTARRSLLICALLLAVPAVMAAQSSPAGALHWRSVGPFTGGRVTTVAGIPDQPNVFYMGTAGGGVWETTDYGHNWHNISDRDFKTGSIGAMAVAPSNSKILYVGTGDSAPRNTVLTGGGMYKST